MRVIAGRFGGRTLVAPRGKATRPTSDRVREALFSILGDVAGTRVLDLFAGSGALGIEALSRGAAAATFVESSRAARACIDRNLDALGLTSRTRVLGTSVERSAKALTDAGPFELVLCDPPWAELPRVAPLLGRLLPLLLAPGARVVLEHPAGDEPSLAVPSLELAERRAWGDTGASFYSVILEDSRPQPEPNGC